MRIYNGSDTLKMEPEGIVGKILERLERLELLSGELEAKLDIFSEEMFGFTHDLKKEDQSKVGRGICGEIQFRISNIHGTLNGMFAKLNAILDELPQKKECSSSLTK